MIGLGNFSLPAHLIKHLVPEPLRFSSSVFLLVCVFFFDKDAYHGLY